jgi:transposase
MNVSFSDRSRKASRWARVPSETKRGFALQPLRWLVERGFAWATRFRQLARDFERLAAALAAPYCP